VPLPLAYRDLVDGDPLEPAELGPGEAVLQVALRDVLDHIPADPEVPRHVEDRQAPRQLERVPLERLGVAPARGGEADLDLPGHPAARAGDTGDGDHDEHGLGADGHGAEPPLDRAMRPHVPGPAYRAPQRLAGLADGEVDLTPDGLGADVLVAAHGEPVVQEA